MPTVSPPPAPRRIPPAPVAARVGVHAGTPRSARVLLFQFNASGPSPQEIAAAWAERLTEQRNGFSRTSSLDFTGVKLTGYPDILLTPEFSTAKALVLSINKIPSLPEEINLLPYLVDLRVAFNTLSHLPDSLGDLANLVILYLSNNSLTKLPDSFGNLQNLIELDLSNNSRTISLPRSFVTLKNLSILTLSKTRVELPANWDDAENVLPSSIKSLLEEAAINPPVRGSRRGRNADADPDPDLTPPATRRMR